MANEDVKTLIKRSGLKNYQVADYLGMNDGNFSRKLRHELSDSEKETIKYVVDRLLEGKSEEVLDITEQSKSDSEIHSEMPEMPKINVISTKRACEILAEHGMKTDPQKIGLGLQQKVYPFGVAILNAKRWCYEIYENLLYQWIEERSS